jgi:hypothetical protein
MSGSLVSFALFENLENDDEISNCSERLITITYAQNFFVINRAHRFGLVDGSSMRELNINKSTLSMSHNSVELGHLVSLEKARTVERLLVAGSFTLRDVCFSFLSLKFGLTIFSLFFESFFWEAFCSR